MPDEKIGLLSTSQLRERALARWENEGGASACGVKTRTHQDDEASDVGSNTGIKADRFRAMAPAQAQPKKRPP